MMYKLWERYFLREFIKIFCLFLFGFYGLYVLIDYSNHASSFQSVHHHFKLREIASYYAYDFVQRVEVLIPFALLISTIRVLTSLNVHHELVALMASGIPIKRLLSPFIFVALICIALLYVNTEFSLPQALKEIKHISEKMAKKKNKSSRLFPVQHLILEDQTPVIYQRYDSVSRSLYDAYWIRSIDDVYRIKVLDLGKEVPAGKDVEHFVRTPEGNLIVGAFYPEMDFPTMRFNKHTFETLTPPDELALSHLWNKLPSQQHIHSEKQTALLSNFYYKLAMPWLCIFAVLGPAPFCVRFSRTMPVFFIYACAIFALVGIYLLVDATTLLGKRQVIPPFWAVWTPFLIVGSWTGWKFYCLK